MNARLKGWKSHKWSFVGFAATKLAINVTSPASFIKNI